MQSKSYLRIEGGVLVNLRSSRVLRGRAFYTQTRHNHIAFVVQNEILKSVFETQYYLKKGGGAFWYSIVVHVFQRGDLCGVDGNISSLLLSQWFHAKF